MWGGGGFRVQKIPPPMAQGRALNWRLISSFYASRISVIEAIFCDGFRGEIILEKLLAMLMLRDIKFDKLGSEIFILSCDPIHLGQAPDPIFHLESGAHDDIMKDPDPFFLARLLLPIFNFCEFR